MWDGSDEQMSIQTILAALDHGINLIDTAPVYGFGRAEEIVGKAVKEFGSRDKVRIATKAGLEWKDGEVSRNSQPAHIAFEIEDSLRRLQTDYIDIYFVHWPDSPVPFEETARMLQALQDQGKIRLIGVSNFDPRQMDAFQRAADLRLCQPPYNLFERDIEKDLIPYCRRHDIALMTYGALCRGLLSGKMSSDRVFEGDDLRRVDPKFQPPRFGQYLEAAARIAQLAASRYGKDLLPAAVRWVLDQGIQISVWGARRPEQIEPVHDVFGWSLDAESKNEIDKIIAAAVTDPVGPEFMAPPVDKGSGRGVSVLEQKDLTEVL
jgi:aryl-alcohol dehydrogenase-like predicted oxidoreductase